MKSAVADDVWTQIASAFTDGDAAMAAALAQVVPGAVHIRCRYHLEANLRNNLYKVLGGDIDEFISQWKDAVNEANPTDFEAARRRLHSAFPAAVPYLDKNHWKLEKLFFCGVLRRRVLDLWHPQHFTC
jgi:hypothetical protein